MQPTLRSLFLPALDRFSERPALRAGRAETSYSELVTAANRLAQVLVARGVTPGTPVALMMSNRSEWVIADQAMVSVLTCSGSVVVGRLLVLVRMWAVSKEIPA